MGRKVTDHEVVELGIDYPDYFQGFGVAFSDFDTAFVGIGSSAHEAFEDALENAAMSGWEVDSIENDLSPENLIEHYLEEKGVDPNQADILPWVYVGLRVKGGAERPIKVFKVYHYGWMTWDQFREGIISPYAEAQQSGFQCGVLGVGKNPRKALESAKWSLLSEGWASESVQVPEEELGDDVVADDDSRVHYFLGLFVVE